MQRASSQIVEHRILRDLRWALPPALIAGAIFGVLGGVRITLGVRAGVLPTSPSFPRAAVSIFAAAVLAGLLLALARPALLGRVGHVVGGALVGFAWTLGLSLALVQGGAGSTLALYAQMLALGTLMGAVVGGVGFTKGDDAGSPYLSARVHGRRVARVLALTIVVSVVALILVARVRE